MKKVLNLHRKNTENIGDLVCAPYRYFPELLGSETRDFLGFSQKETPERDDRVAFHETFQQADVIVVGGGGLLEIDFFEPAHVYLRERKAPHHKVVLWGAGHNEWRIEDWRKLKKQFTFDASPFDLIGVRDFNHSHEWVPCVSCMHEAFDRRREITRAVGVYAHAATMKKEAFRKQLPEHIETIDNSSPLDVALDFIGSSELVLTDSYHGAYWAVLMGRKVVAFPTSSKFYDMRHPVPLCAPEDWERSSLLARTYDNALFECRAATRSFAEKVADLL